MVEIGDKVLVMPDGRGGRILMPFGSGGGGGGGSDFQAFIVMDTGGDEAYAGNNVNFSAVVQGGTGPYTYAWQFLPSMATASTSSCVVVFPSEGYYTAKLTVTDSLGATAYAEMGVHINANAPTPAPTIYMAYIQALYPGREGLLYITQNIRLVAVINGGTAPFTYLWDVDDGSPMETTATVTHKYTAVGIYLAHLQVTDNNSNVSDAYYAITVTDTVGDSTLVTTEGGGSSSHTVTISQAEGVLHDVTEYINPPDYRVTIKLFLRYTIGFVTQIGPTQESPGQVITSRLGTSVVSIINT